MKIAVTKMLLSDYVIPGVVLASILCIVVYIFFQRNSKEKQLSAEAFANFKYESSSVTNILSREQMDAIVLRQWKKVMAWVVFHSDQVSRVEDTNGQTVLHHAALFRAPAQVMELLLWAAPELASVPNKEGELALHWAVRLSTPGPVLTLLLQANPEGAFWVDCHGTTPIALLWERHHISLLHVWRSEREKLLSETHSIWRRIMSIYRTLSEAESLQNRVGQRGDDNLFRPLHMAAAYPSPPCLFPLMLQVYRDEIIRRDSMGHTLLAVACSSPSSNRSCDVLTKIEQILREVPETARAVDSSGRHPLHIAASSGILWEEGVKCLIQAYPLTLSLPDPQTRLLPFALAAQSKQPSSSRSQTEECEFLDTVYNILRENPSVLRLSGF